MLRKGEAADSEAYPPPPILAPEPAIVAREVAGRKSATSPMGNWTTFCGGRQSQSKGACCARVAPRSAAVS